MANFNKVFLIGNLTRDPELRYTPSGAAVANLGLAVNRYYNTKEGERREEVTFVDVTVWNRQAENCCQYLKKGRPVHVEGYLKMDSWDDKATGEKKSKLKVEAENVQFLDSRGGGGGDSGSETEFQAAPSREPRRPAVGTGASRGSFGPPASEPAPSRRSAPEPSRDDDEDEDIPF